MDREERYSRQSKLVPAEKLALQDVAVIGVGAIGRQVALQLTAMGVEELRLIDHDIVEESNIASQGYQESDLGSYKVDATAFACRSINGDVSVKENAHKFRKRQSIGNIIFCCVDSIAIRRNIWESRPTRRDLFIDGRMSAEVIRVITAATDQQDECDYYPTTLFEPEDAFSGSCTAKSTIYSANMAAALMVSQYAKWLREFPYEKDVMLNLLTMELELMEQGA